MDAGSFPSVEWFEALARLANDDPEFRRLGTIDAIMGVRVGETVVLVRFEGFRCDSVRTGTADDLGAADFVLTLSEERWREILANIREHHGADRDHTLNTLDLRTPGGIVSSPSGDQLRADLFFRYNQSLQHFFDLSARLPS
jgi:hypothetical protein